MTTLLNRMFGLKAKRLADLIGQQGRDAYDALGIKVDAKLNSMVLGLMELEAATSTELAKRTGLSRQLVESRIRQLENAGQVTSDVDPEDARRRLYRLSKHHAQSFAAVMEVMTDFEDVYEALWEEIGVDVSDAISRMERALERSSLTERLCHVHPKYQKQKERA